MKQRSQKFMQLLTSVSIIISIVNIGSELLAQEYDLSKMTKQKLSLLPNEKIKPEVDRLEAENARLASQVASLRPYYEELCGVIKSKLSNCTALNYITGEHTTSASMACGSAPPEISITTTATENNVFVLKTFDGAYVSEPFYGGTQTVVIKRNDKRILPPPRFSGIKMFQLHAVASKTRTDKLRDRPEGLNVTSFKIGTQSIYSEVNVSVPESADNFYAYYLRVTPSPSCYLSQDEAQKLETKHVAR